MEIIAREFLVSRIVCLFQVEVVLICFFQFQTRISFKFFWKIVKRDLVWYAQSANRFPQEPIICPIFQSFQYRIHLLNIKDNFQRQIKISRYIWNAKFLLLLFDNLPKCKRSHFFDFRNQIFSPSLMTANNWLMTDKLAKFSGGDVPCGDWSGRSWYCTQEHTWSSPQFTG